MQKPLSKKRRQEEVEPKIHPSRFKVPKLGPDPVPGYPPYRLPSRRSVGRRSPGDYMPESGHPKDELSSQQARWPKMNAIEEEKHPPDDQQPQVVPGARQEDNIHANQ